jgi:hypothetical protein
MQASPPQINGYVVPSRSKLLMESPFIIRPINHIFGIRNKISENSTVNNNCSTHVLTFKTSPLPRTTRAINFLSMVLAATVNVHGAWLESEYG